MDLESGQGQPQPPPPQSIFQLSSNPTALIFLFLFRSLAVFFYIFGRMVLGDDTTMIYVLIILMLAFDFWTVKNISGRLLVGLRWWNEIKDDGSNEWIFESRENRQVNQTDSTVFWTVLYVYPAVWVLFAVMSMFTLSWFVISLIGASMSTVNLIGYIRCEKDYKKKMISVVSQQSFVQNMMSSAISSRLFGA